MLNIEPIATLTDNYVWHLSRDGEHWLVDPGPDPAPLVRLQRQAIRPAGVLITHRHWDHVDGLPDLLEAFPGLPVWGPAGAPHVTHTLAGGDRVTVLGVSMTALATPGHTREHLSYHCSEAEALFCGDTLFAAGCGRILDGTPEQLYHSLQSLAELPDCTRVYCAHEYTVTNLRFAKTVEPDNLRLAERLQECLSLRQQGAITLPSRLDLERATNPFLRTAQAQVRAAAEAHAGHRLDSDQAVFGALRKWKDVFK